jgi:aspartate/methionine/tyrosine aminotransferase
MLSNRAKAVDASGIRKVFDLAARLEHPVNLSIGQPDFPVPDPVRAAARAAIEAGKNSYTQTQGIAELIQRVRDRIRRVAAFEPEDVLITSGTSGGLLLALMALVDPGDEVLCPDPYFVMYPQLARLLGATATFYDLYPDFGLRPERVEAAVTPRTKLIILNSPANPTGAVFGVSAVRDTIEIARKRGIVVLTDEVYDSFCYEGEVARPGRWYDKVVTLNGYSKSHALTGWRVGFAAGPREVIQAMAKLQQYTFVCSPSMAQWGALAAEDVDMSSRVAEYRGKRDRIYGGLAKAGYEVEKPGGAFYIFPKAPWGTATEFVAEAIRRNLLVIPGNVFSRADTHFRISYAASDSVIDEGLGILASLRKV